MKLVLVPPTVGDAEKTHQEQIFAYTFLVACNR